jgi:hypothetical protein
MSTQHTKGPWRDHGTHIEGVDGELIAAVTTYGTATPRQKANARLIAAAPENYACNKDLAKIVRELCATYGHPLPAASLDRSDAAIAKATGQ